jgi:hypothetical protein
LWWTIPKESKLQKTFESQSLCAFNVQDQRKEQQSGQWIISKKEKSEIYSVKSGDIMKTDYCLHSEPYGDSIYCPDNNGKDYFKAIVAYKKESIIELK